MKDQRTKNIILGLLVISIVGYIYYSYYLENEINRISKVCQGIDQKKATIAKLNAEENVIDEKIIEAKQQSKKINKQIPDTFDKKEYIRYFYELVKDTGVSGDRITFVEPEANDKGYKAISASLVVSGEYNAVRNFVDTIENDKRKYVVRQISSKQSEDGSYNISLTLEFYSLR